jgi:hypothetical protein
MLDRVDMVPLEMDVAIPPDQMSFFSLLCLREHGGCEAETRAWLRLTCLASEQEHELLRGFEIVSAPRREDQHT